jgi:hypothetical protein
VEGLAGALTSAFAGFLRQSCNRPFQGSVAQFVSQRTFPGFAAAVLRPALAFRLVERDIGFHAWALQPGKGEGDGHGGHSPEGCGECIDLDQGAMQRAFIVNKW